MRYRRAHLAPLLGALVAAGLFCGLAAWVTAQQGSPLGWDVTVHRWVVGHRNRFWTDCAIVITTTGTGLPAYVLAAVAGAMCVTCRPRWSGAAIAAGALAAGQLVRIALATWIGRPRPPATDWAWHAGGPAFPSGHTTTSALVAAMFCAALVPGRRGPVRTAGLTIVVLWAVSVGLTRIFLGVHWPSDVVAAWLLAAALVLSAWTVISARPSQ